MKKITILILLVVLLPGISCASSPLDRLVAGMLPASAKARLLPAGPATTASKFNVVLEQQKAAQEYRNYCQSIANKVRDMKKIACPRCKCQYHEQDASLHNMKHQFVDSEIEKYNLKCSKDVSCTQLFKDVAARNRHERSHDNRDPFVCIQCSASYPSLSLLDSHLLWHSRNDSKYEATIAAFKASLETVIAKTKAEIGQNTGKRAHNNNTIPGQPPAKKQKGEVEDVAQAPIARASAAAAGSSDLGQKINDKEFKETFACHKCVASFDSKSKLNRHLKYHENKDKYTIKCSVDPNCPQLFFSRNTEQLHCLNHTQANNQNLHKCDYCTASFGNVHCLNKHLLWHSNGSSKAVLRASVKAQSGRIIEKINGKTKYICNINGCPEKYVNMAGLAVHSRLHQRKSEFECEKCGAAYAGLTNLDKHLKKHQMVSDDKDKQKKAGARAAAAAASATDE